MRFLFTRFPLESRLHGGAERQVITVMEGLMQRGHAVAFLGSCPALLQLCREKGIPTAELHIGPPPVTKWHAMSFLWRRRSMRRKLAEAIVGFHALDAIVMLSLSEKLLLTPLLASYQYTDPSSLIPTFWLEHDPVGRWLTANPWLPQLRRLSKQVTTITVSDLSRNLYVKLGFPPDHVIAIPNGIDFNRFAPLEGNQKPQTLRQSSGQATHIPLPGQEYRVGGEGLGERPNNTTTKTGRGLGGEVRMRVGCVSRLDYEKGLDLLITAVKNITNVSLTIVGTGREERNLRRMLRRSVLDDRVQIFPNTDDLAAFYRSLDLFILPSRTHDPFGLVAAEAMGLGIPVIATDACGIASYLHHGEDAVIVKANDASALQEGMRTMMDLERRKLVGEEGKELATREFSVERMIDRYESLFRTVPPISYTK